LKTKEQVAGVQTEEFEDEIIEGALKRPAGRALGLNPQSASDEDFQTCEKASGDQGIAACDRAIAGGKFTGRNLSYLHNDRGFLRMQKGELDQALVDLDEAIRIDASNFFAFWNRGAVYGAKSDFARAQEDFTKALALNPDDTTKAKIVEALNVVVAAAAAAKTEANDPSVITIPTWGNEQGVAGSAASSFPADAAMPASPSIDAMPALPASPPPPAGP
jgi:tetratricopeptide (TPR) repeat protein